MIITIANQKGGVGKTTIATHIACLSAGERKHTTLIDADTQGSAMSFRALRSDSMPQFQAFSILTDTIHKDLKTLNSDFIVIDAGGRDGRVFRSAIMGSDIVIVPVTPSQYDIWSSEETFKIINEIRLVNEKLKALVVLNQVIAGTNISKEVMEVMNGFLETYRLNLLKTVLYSRIAYKESVSEGLAVTEINQDKFKKAAQEMNDFYMEVKQYAS